MIYFISDTHFGTQKQADKHFNGSLIDLETYLIDHWNSIVKDNDIVFHLGDVAKENAGQYIKRLKGHKKLLRGNHDNKVSLSDGFEAIYDVYYLRDNKKKFVLCHFPFASWRSKEFGAYHLHGHMHGDNHREELGEAQRRLDISSELRLWSIDEVITLCK